MRTKGLSIKELDERKKEQLRSFLGYLHNTKGMSLNDIAKLIGNKTSGYASWVCRELGVQRRPFEEARLKGIREKRRKYERKPFDGTDEDKAYLLGLRHGDLSASRPWKDVVRVPTSTTHPAMAELFRSLFEPYGHVYQDPRYKKDTKTYEWNLYTVLDSTFDFLLQEFGEVKDWLASSPSILLAYLSGFLDADGSILTTKDKYGCVTVFVDYYNANKELLLWIRTSIEQMGYRCSLRLNKAEGVKTKKYGIAHRKDYWQLSAFGMNNVQELVSRLAPRHREKVRKRGIALGAVPGELYERYEKEVVDLRMAIRAQVGEFVRKAEARYLAKHPVPPCSV